MPPIDPRQLAAFLGQDIEQARAALVITQAEALCRAVVDPLPEGGGAVVLSVAARAYANPQGLAAGTVGPHSVQRPAAQVGRPPRGVPGAGRANEKTPRAAVSVGL